MGANVIYLGKQHEPLVPYGGTRMFATDRLECAPDVDTRRRHDRQHREDCLALNHHAAVLGEVERDLAHKT